MPTNMYPSGSRNNSSRAPSIAETIAVRRTARVKLAGLADA